VQNDSAPKQKARHNDRQAHETAFGKNDVRPEADEDEKRLKKADDDEKRIGEIPPGKITAPFSRKNPAIRNTCIFEQCFIESAAGTDIQQFCLWLFSEYS
jgi:hypothetical protein